jgi:5-methyltetrahydrofolate--homocysteine methyltransferase
VRNTYIDNWQTVKDSFEQWWNRENRKKPLMRIIAAGKQGKTVPVEAPKEPREKWLNLPYVMGTSRNYFESHYFLADAYPSLTLTMGAGSMALYLGSEPEFDWYTIWFTSACAGPGEFRNLRYDENNPWWVLHQKLLKEAVELSKGDFFVNIPDIIENLDILSALRSPQNLCYDIMDEPGLVHEGVKIIDDLYFKYYDRCYELIRDEDNSSAFLGFNVLGKGRVAKLQCDFSALISPQVFRDYVQPSLRKQCQKLDHSVYHLDGPDAIKHVPALMEIKELDALQWTCGAGKPDGGSENWYPIYDQVKEAGKSLWIYLSDGSPEDRARNAQKLVKRYGATGLYLLFPDFPDLQSAKKMAALFD